MRRSTFLLGLSSFDSRNASKISLFVYIISLSFSIRFFFPFSLVPFSFLLASRILSLIQHTPPFVCSPFHFLFFFFFSFLFPFSLLSLFYFFFLNRIYQSGGNFPHFPLSHVSSPCIFLIFLYFFSFFFITLFNTLLNVSHLFQVHHMAHAMCHFPRVSYGIHMIMPCVTRHPMPRKT